MNGNWAQLDMTSELGASTTMASLALTAFWAMVTVGRVLFAADPAAVPDPSDLPPAAVRARGAFVHHRARCPAAHPALGVVGLRRSPASAARRCCR